MHTVGTRVVSAHNETVTGTVIGVEYICRETGDGILRVEWDADTWSEYREVDSVWSDELINLLAV